MRLFAIRMEASGAGVNWMSKVVKKLGDWAGRSKRVDSVKLL